MLLLVAVSLAAGGRVWAQAPASGQGALRSISDAPGADRLTPSELEELLGPVALYPDPLLANVLAASVYPDEVAEAAKFIMGGGRAEQIDAKPWEDPVKAVAKIPDAIKMMGEYRDWTIAMGQAYLVQAMDVMDVVQSLRKQAQASGALQTSLQQKVVVEQQIVYIKPADPEVIYVPTYSPSVVYVEKDDRDAVVAGVVGFGLGVATGLILANNLDCDWHGGCVGYGWHGGGYRGGNNDIAINGDVNIGNRNTNISGNNVRNAANVGNRVGNEGNAWAPNKSKSLASAKQNEMSRFKGGATAANRAEVPGGRRTAANAANRPAGARAQPGGRSPQAAARPTAQPAARTGAARPPSPGASPRVPRTPPRQTGESAFSGGRATEAQSQRGAASRAQSRGGATRSPAARSGGGGGGARGGGGGRGGGGRGR